jgi:Ca-activated chloride channel family protein
MNTRRILFGLTALAVALSACSPAATPYASYTPAPSLPTSAIGLPAPTAEAFATSAPIAGAYAPTATAAGPLVEPTQPVDMNFQNYGVNPFVDAREDHLSTFALDVDTASYALTRRYVEGGQLPPPEAVRVEEFVNSFDQGYTPPPDVAFAIYADGAPSLMAPAGTQMIRVGIQGYEVPADQRKPANLTFVIDVSGSMDMENRLGLVKRALELLVEQLRGDDTVAIVVYGSDARLVLPATSGADSGTILSAIYGLRTEGATNAEAGLRVGYSLAASMFRAEAINRVILLSDGVANVGATGPDEILESIRGYADAGIQLTTLGFGMGNFNDVLMEQLADNGDGVYGYIDSLEEAQKLLVEGLTGTLQTIALDAKVQVDFNPETVARYRLIGYENRAVADQDFRNDAVDAGELGAGHTATALYAVQMVPGAQGRLATVQLRWEDPDTHVVREINGNFNTYDLAPSFEATAPRYQVAVTAAIYAELLRHSPWGAGYIGFNQLYANAQRLTAQLPDDPQVAELADLLARSLPLEAGLYGR